MKRLTMILMLTVAVSLPMAGQQPAPKTDPKAAPKTDTKTDAKPASPAQPTNSASQKTEPSTTDKPASATPQAMQPDQPLQPLPGDPAGASSTPATPEGFDAETAAASDDVTEMRPLSGSLAQTLTPAGRSRDIGHVMFMPSFSAGTSWDSAAQQTPSGARKGDIVNNFGGQLELQRVTRASQTALRYSGGGTIYQENDSFNSSYHRVAAHQAFRNRRWTVTFGDQAEYLPQSPFGYSHFLPSERPIDLGSSFAPDQSIGATEEKRLSNTALGEVTYRFSKRISGTASGGYGFLHFLNDRSALFDSWQANGKAGLDFTLTRRDSIALAYDTMLQHFENTGLEMRTHAVQLTYARRLAARMNFSIGGGPQLTRIDDPRFKNRLGEAVSAQWQYAFQRAGQVGFNYSRGVTGGSGVLQGAINDSAGASYSFSRRGWSTSWHFGYTHSEQLTQLRAATTATALGYSGFTGGVSVSRNLARGMSLYFGYTATQQDNLIGIPCTGPGCTNDIRHNVNVGLSWRPEPIRLQ